jgi:hypothetical protein
MHAEPIGEQLVKENVPGDVHVNTFEEWAAYTRSNAIVSPVCPHHSSHLEKKKKHNTALFAPCAVDFPSYRDGRARTGVLARYVEMDLLSETVASSLAFVQVWSRPTLKYIARPTYAL